MATARLLQEPRKPDVELTMSWKEAQALLVIVAGSAATDENSAIYRALERVVR